MEFKYEGRNSLDFVTKIKPVIEDDILIGVDWAKTGGDYTQETFVIIDELHEHCDENEMNNFLSATTVRSYD